jgi:hypothetical protein
LPAIRENHKISNFGMSDLEGSAGNKVEKANKHKLISGENSNNVGENVSGSEKFFQNLEKPLVENSPPNDTSEPPGHEKPTRNQRLEGNHNLELAGSNDEVSCNGIAGSRSSSVGDSDVSVRKVSGEGIMRVVGSARAGLHHISDSVTRGSSKDTTLGDPLDENGRVVGPARAGLNHGMEGGGEDLRGLRDTMRAEHMEENNRLVGSARAGLNHGTDGECEDLEGLSGLGDADG